MRHPDEGTIHAWLDGALSPEEVRALEAHVQECEPCAALVVEARGYLAGASRILSALDDAPRGVVPTAASPGTRAGAPAPAARPMRFRAARYRIAAALVILAGGAYVVAREAPPDDDLLDRALESATEAPAISTAIATPREDSGADGGAPAPGSASPAGGGAAPHTGERAAPAQDAAASMATPRRDVERRAQREQTDAAARVELRAPPSGDSLPGLVSGRPVISNVLPRREGRSDSAAPGMKVIANRAAPSAAPAPAPPAAGEEELRQERARTPAMQRSGIAASGIAAPAEAPSWAAPACYAIEFGAWPASIDDERRRALTPPRWIRLDTVPGNEALESGTAAVRPAAGAAASAHRFAEWKPTGESALIIRFSDGFQGVELDLVRDGEELRGRARGTGDASGAGETPVRLTRIACDAGR